MKFVKLGTEWPTELGTPERSVGPAVGHCCLNQLQKKLNPDFGQSSAQLSP